MRSDTVIFFLCAAVAVLAAAVVYQQAAFRRGTQRKLARLTRELREILDADSAEKVMIFTDNPRLKELAEQINRLLEEKQRLRADFARMENASKKMLSNISHDMKTPMTVLLGYLEIMQLQRKEKDELLDRVEKKAQDVMALIDEFFTLAKLEAGDQKPGRERIDAAECIRETVLDFYEILSRQAFTVEVDVPEEPVYAAGDEEALRRILCNLISNAVRYGADGKYLRAALRREDGAVCIDIEDHGKGIEKEFAGTIFERLFTLEDSRNREIQGNGLGLTIAKNLAVQMGGDIFLESRPGDATVFTVKLLAFSGESGGERNS